MFQKQAWNNSEMGSKLQRDNVTFNNKKQCDYIRFKAAAAAQYSNVMFS